MRTIGARKKTTSRAVAAALLAGLLAAMWYLGTRPVRAPRLLGPMTSAARATPAPPVAVGTTRLGGIGRFTRPRTALPNRF